MSPTMMTAVKPPDEEQRLAALREAEILDTPPEGDFDEVTDLLAALCGVPIALVVLVDDDRLFFKSRVGLDVTEVPRDIAYCAHTILGDDLFIVPDMQEDPRFSDSPFVVADPFVRFYAGAPLTTREGHNLGTLCVLDRKPRDLAPEQRKALRTLARQVSGQLELRRANARLRKRAREAEEARAALEVFEDVVQNSTSMISVWHRESRGAYTLRFLNRAMRRSSPALLDGVVGKSMSEIFPDFTAPESVERIEQVLATAAPCIYETARRFGGKELHLQVSLIPLPGENLGIAVDDIGARKAVEQMKNEFVSTVSHELRTPLTSIRGALGLLEGNVIAQLPEELMEIVLIARSSTDRLIRLINDILDLEKLDSGKLELRLATVDVERLVATTLDAMRPYADEAGVTLTADVRNRPEIVADADRLAQVLTNLVSNAVKFSPAGERVELRVEPSAFERLRFSIHDRGPGIADHARARLFGRFEQLDSGDGRRPGGTGLGLSISKAIVEQHGGVIGVDSTVGQGSTFWFELRGGTSSRPAVRSDRPIVLIVEDDPSLGKVLRARLAAEGYQVIIAQTLEEAEGLIHTPGLGAVLLDVHLPDGNGLVLIERLRAQTSTQGVPVVVMSGDKAEEHAYTRPMLVDWLEKPFPMWRLAATLRWAARSKTRARVLVVEDDEDFRALLARQLQSLGVEVVQASSGEEAIRLTRAAQPDLIILDIGLPHRDGFEVVAALREQASDTPLVVYTGRDVSAEERAALRLGITHHLTKSRTSADEFVSIVRDLLDGLLKDPSGP